MRYVVLLLILSPMAESSALGQQPTLPPVVVTPPLEEGGGNSETTVPPGTSARSTVEENSPSWMDADNYPPLSSIRLGGQGRFGETSGVLREATSVFDTPAAVSVRPREEILERQAPDMFHALQNEVGVLLQSTAAGQASPFIRGLTGQQILVLVDGIRLNNSIVRRGPNQYFNTIDPGMVDHIEVLRGQGSVLWGADAIGGAINVVSRSPNASWGDYREPEYIQYFNTSNSSPYSRGNVDAWGGQLGVFAGGSYLDVRNLDTGWGMFSRQPGTNYQQYAGDIKFKYLVDRDQMLTVSLQHFEQEQLSRSDRFPGYPLDRNLSNTPSGARFFDPQQRDLGYLRYQAVDVLGGAVDALTLTASHHRQREVQTRGMPTTRFQETDVGTTGVQLIVAKDLDVYGKVFTGVDWYHDDVDSRFGGSANGPIVPDDAWYRRIGWYLNWDVELTERLDAVAGIRYEATETAGTPVVMGRSVYINPQYDDWIGQLGLVYKLNPQVHLVGSISEGFRAPNLDDLMANNPNVLQQGQSLPSLGLSPENSVNYEVGLKADYDRWRSQMFVYWMDLGDNLVSIQTEPNTFATANQDSTVQGFEFAGEWLWNAGWSVYGNFWYTYGRNRVTRAPLSRIPPMQGIAGIRYRAPYRSAYFTFYTWMSDRQDRLDPVRDVTDERIPIGGTPGFATLNLRAGRVFGQHKQHHLSLSLENLADQPYLVHGSGVLGTGFTARFGYRFDY